MTDLPILDTPPPPAGHNRPTLDILTKPELIEDNGPLIQEVDALKAQGQKLVDDLKPVADMTDTEIDTVLVSMIGIQNQITTLTGKIETARKEKKQPYYTIGQAIDGFYNSDLRDALAPVKTKIAVAGGPITVEKDRRAREVAKAAAAAAAAAEAERLQKAADLEAQGRHTEADIQMRAAEATSADVYRAENKATTPQNLGRTSSFAGSGGTRYEEAFSIDRTKVDLEALRPFIDEEAIIKAAKRWRTINKNQDITGITVSQNPLLSSRR